jgi:hypothetical protein
VLPIRDLRMAGWEGPLIGGESETEEVARLGQFAEIFPH